MELDLDRVLEVLGDKIVQTSKGPYVSVKDLKALDEELKGMKEADKPTGKATSLLEARRAAMKDPEILAAFKDPVPKAPADAGVVKPVSQEKTDEAA